MRHWKNTKEKIPATTPNNLYYSCVAKELILNLFKAIKSGDFNVSEGSQTCPRLLKTLAYRYQSKCIFSESMQSAEKVINIYLSLKINFKPQWVPFQTPNVQHLELHAAEATESHFKRMW